jgi:DNA-binding NarL/FixJ family response regulator
MKPTSLALKRNAKQILLVEDHPIYADGISSLIHQLSTFTEVSNVTSINDALFEVAKRRFDLILLDLTLSDGDGQTFLSSIKPGPDFTPIVIISGTDDREAIEHALSLGACGYLSKMENTAKLGQAISEFLSIGDIDSGRFLPTPRQQAVLTEMSNGLSVKETARVLCISDNTVKYHIKVIYGLLSVSSRTDCLRRASELNLLQ